MRAQAFFAAALCLSWSGAPTGLQVQSWLQRPGTRGLAVLFLPASGPEFSAATETLRELHARHHGKGLRVVIVAKGQDSRCADVPWVDQLICDNGLVMRGYGVPQTRPSALLWDWQGQLLAQGDLRNLQAILPLKGLSLEVWADGEDAAAVSQAFVRAAARDARFTRQGRITTTAPEVLPPCPKHLPATRALRLRAHLRASRLQAELQDLSAGCTRAQREVSVQGRALTKAAEALLTRLAAVMTAAPQAPNREAQEPPAATVPGVAAPASGSSALQDFVAQWLGTRFRQGGTDHRGIDSPHFAYELHKAVYGRDLSPDLLRQLNSGPEVPLDVQHPDRTLRPGDLLFYVSYGYLPRSVMVYLGQGKVAQAVLIRGVVVDDLPTSVPDYLYLVARRPY